MKEMMFNKPENKIEYKKSSSLKVFIWVALLLIVIGSLLFLPGLASMVKNKFSGEVTFTSNDNSEYSAIFLDNGQVYFGKINESNDKEMTLINVFYLQAADNSAAAQAELNQAKFNLIKLGTELHGPADILRVNRTHVVFYEELRKDSKIVESISNFQKNNQ